MSLRRKNLFSFIQKAFSLPDGLRAHFAPIRFLSPATLLLAGLAMALQAHAVAGCFSAPPGLVGWWPGDGSAADIASTNNGTLQGGATANATGMVAQAFSFDGTNGFVQIPNAPALEPTNLTVEAWVRFSSLDTPALGGSPAGSQYIVFKQNSRSGNFEGFDLSKTRVGGSDVFLFLVTSASAQSSEVHSVTTISTNVWYHIAGVRGSNFLQIYVNGVFEQQTNVTFPQDYGNFPLYFGTSGESYWDHKLAGNLDEVSLYNRALSSSEIAAIYAVGSSGKCKAPNITAQPANLTALAGSNPSLSVTATGLAPLAYQWSFNGTPIPGATNSSVTLTNVQFANDGNYSVTVTNNLGVDVSSNALLLVNDVQPGVPFITGFTPATAVAGTSVTLSGYNFSTTPAGNIVYFGSVLANVTAASSSNLTVTVPVGAIFAPITVNVNGLMAWSHSPFQPTFIGSGSLNSGTFANSFTEPFANGPIKAVIADLDGDGKPDVIFADGYGQAISILRNISTPGSLTANSFAPRVDIPGTYASGSGPLWVQAADIDGDGKLDLIVGDYNNNNILIYRNISTPGSLTSNSFAPPVIFSVNASPRYFRIADIDGDGKPDIIVPAYGSNVVTILQNVGTPGNLNSNSFVRYDLPTGSGPVDVAIADFNGDGQPDLAVLLNGSAQVQVYRNVSVPGSAASTWFVPDVSFPTLNTPNGINAGDFDGDGKPDLAVASYLSSAVTIYRNTTTSSNFPACSFDPGVTYGTIGRSHDVEVADLNGDQKPDLVADGELSDFMRVFQNNISAPGPFGSNSLQPQVDFPTGYNAWGVAVGDLDGDGRPDIVLGNAYDNTITFYQNQTPYGGPPFFQIQPTNFTVTVGNTATFSAAAQGLVPIAYQWQFNGSNIPGASSTQLYLPDVQSSQAGNYSVIASNSIGAATSSVAVLTVNSTPACTAPPSGLVSWWTGDNTTLDSASTNEGTLIGDASYGPGRINSAFVLDGNASGVSVGNPADLQLQNFTIAAWIQRASSAQVTFSANGTALIFGYGSGGYGFGIGNSGVLFLTHVDTDNDVISAGITDTNFHYVAVTKNGFIVTFYIDGVAYPAPVYGDTFAFTSQAAIGNRADTLASGFFGSIDDVAVFNRALAPSEIQSIYNSGGAGMCALPPSIVVEPASQTNTTGTNAVFSVITSGSPPLGYQWFDGAAPLSDNGHFLGSTSNVLTISNLLTSDSGNYSVVVANAVGAQTSTVAALTVYAPPSFVIQPVGQMWLVGSNYTLTSLATGTQPINYQWFENGVMMTDTGHFTGTATSTLSVSNVATSDAATYTVVASNFSAVTSSNAVITVVVPPAIITQPRGFSAPPGFTVTFTGVASGSAPLGYQWLLNGSPVSPGSGPSLTVSNIAPANYGNYQLVATNAGGSATSTVAQLTLGPVGTWGTFNLENATAAMLPAAGLSNVVASAAGSGYDLALRGDGTVYEWGMNTQVANLPANLTDIVGIAAGDNHALALHANGTVTAWGLNTSGQANVPPGLSNVIAVSAATAHSAALRSDGTVVVWGVSGKEAQTNIPPGLFNVTAISAGSSQTIALRADGTAVSWGGSTALSVPYNLTGLMGVAAGKTTELEDPFAMAVGSNGIVSVWGDAGAPTNVPPGLTGVAAVAAGGDGAYVYGFAMALRSNGTVAVWASSNPATAGGPAVVTNIPAGATNVAAISAGWGQALVLINDGRPQIIGPPVGGIFYSGRDIVLNAKAVGAAPLSYLWLKGTTPVGTNSTLDIPSAQPNDIGNYQLIVSNALGVAQSVPVPVALVGRAPALMSQLQNAFAYYGSPLTIGAALTGSGPLTMQWLQNGLPGASGTNILTFSRAMPQQGGTYQLVASNPYGAVTSGVAQITFTRLAQWGTGPALTNAPFNLGTVVAVASGYSHALALNADGTVSAWATNATTATNVPAGLSNVIAIAAGNNSSLALKNDGTVVAWGSTATNVPAGLSNVIAIAAGGTQELALLVNGTVVGWGIGLQATPPPGLSNVVAVSAGSVQSLALKSDGTIVGWGTFGRIPGTTNVVAISAGFMQSLALQADGTVVGWSISGAATALPTNLNNIVAISAGGNYLQQSFAAALKSDGTLVAWGTLDSAGQLSIPPGITSAISISAGSGSTLAYLNDRSPFITAQPFDRHLFSGANVALAAVSVGQPNLNYQWYFNGTNIPGATNASLPLIGVNRASRGDYYAAVWNSLATNISRDMQLQVGGPVKLVETTLATNGGSGSVFHTVVEDGYGGRLTPGDLPFFTVLTSSNLVDWVPLPNSLTYSNGLFILQDPNPPTQPQQYYQLVEP